MSAETWAASPSMVGLWLLLCCDVLQQQDDDPQELTGTWASPSLFYLLLCLFCQCSGREIILTSLWAAWPIKHKDGESYCKANRNN